MSVQFADSPSSSKPSVAELATFASRAGGIDFSDDIVELGDDMGASLLSNPNKVAPSPKRDAGLPFGQVARQVNLGGSSSGAMELPTLEIKPVSDLEAINLDVAPGTADVKINRPDDSIPFVINTGSGVGMSDEGAGDHGGGGGGRMTAQEENREKARLLSKLKRLESDGIKGQRMTMGNTLDEIRAEHDQLTDSQKLEASIRFQRNALMTFVTGLEMANDRFGSRLPVKPRLKGWSESVQTNIQDYDDIFEELYDMYKDKAKVHPVMRLVGQLGVSGVMYHLTTSAAERSGIPHMSDILNEDPELQRLIASRLAAKMGNLGGFMNAASGFGGPPQGPPPMPMGSGRPPTPPGRAAVETRGVPFNASSGPAATVRREMRGPTGVDDILKAFETERLMAQQPQVDASVAGIFTPDGPGPQSMGARGGVGTSVDPLSEFMGDDSSVGTTSTMNTERRRGRRRQAPTPVGATLNLNV
jgi:hypothetical protein